MPAMTSIVPAVETLWTTGATVTTCGSLASTPPILIDIGEPVRPTMNDEPGGITMTSAPMPACLCLESLSNPRQSPTISRIKVTSSAMATTLIRERTGRCARLATIILFIIDFCFQLNKEHATSAVIAAWARCAGRGLIEMHDLDPDWLL